LFTILQHGSSNPCRRPRGVGDVPCALHGLLNKYRLRGTEVIRTARHVNNQTCSRRARATQSVDAFGRQQPDLNMLGRRRSPWVATPWLNMFACSHSHSPSDGPRSSLVVQDPRRDPDEARAGRGPRRPPWWRMHQGHAASDDGFEATRATQSPTMASKRPFGRLQA